MDVEFAEEVLLSHELTSSMTISPNSEIEMTQLSTYVSIHCIRRELIMLIGTTCSLSDV